MGFANFTHETREWFTSEFGTPNGAQTEAWDSIAQGKHTLVSAPTGSGKTLAAFLWAIDQLLREGKSQASTTRVLYVSPLKALTEDVRRNVEIPLAGIAAMAQRKGKSKIPLRIGVRTGDSTAATRRSLLRNPPDILLTTPESLFLMLTSRARDTLRGVRTVIVDEVHDLVGSKRGAHLALSLARLEEITEKRTQRIGLSATIRPLEEAARFLVPHITSEGSNDHEPVATRARVIAPTATKSWDVSVRAAVPDFTNVTFISASNQQDQDTTSVIPERNSLWPHLEEVVFDLVYSHSERIESSSRVHQNQKPASPHAVPDASSVIIFVNSRTVAERVVAALNERYRAKTAPEKEAVSRSALPGGMPAQISSTTYTGSGAPALFARAHHGSVSKEARAEIESDLKEGKLRCVVATSSLELGIDMGLVDIVIQLGAPPSVANGVQRVGRAGHTVGAVSRGIFFPLHSLDIVHSAVIAQRMVDGAIEKVKAIRNPLDVLAQHTVSAASVRGEEGLAVEKWWNTVRTSAPFNTLPRSAFDSVLDMLSGRYPADFFGELRPRLHWDRENDVLIARPGSGLLAITSGGTIPDRGLFGVFLAGEKSSRVGELDEEMVYESRVGDVIQLGATSWRITEITHERVLVVPAPGMPARLAFWKGDTPMRPAELGKAIGEFMHNPQKDFLDENSVDNLERFIEEQSDAVGLVPTDETLVVEYFRDPLGDWFVVLLSPYGRAVHAPWALAVSAKIREKYGVEEHPAAFDDGIVVRLPSSEDPHALPRGAELFCCDPHDIDEIVEREVAGSAMFAARFRECAARALLLPRKKPGQRTALWLQRLRAAQLLDIAQNYSEFPILVETMRECLQDVYDLPALRELLTRQENGSLRLHEAVTVTPSPLARSLMFGYDGVHLYEEDRPRAERRASDLRVDQKILGELLGHSHPAELIDSDVQERVERELQWLRPQRHALNADAVTDMLKELGPLTEQEIAARSSHAPSSWLKKLQSTSRVITYERAGEIWWAAVEDAGRIEEGLGVEIRSEIPHVFREPVADPLRDLIVRYARTHGPFTTEDVARRFAIGRSVAEQIILRIDSIGPGFAAQTWCAREVQRRLRRESLNAARHEISPVGRENYAHFLARWQGVLPSAQGRDALLDVIDQLAGVRVPAQALESSIFPSRVSDFTSTLWDEILTAGEAYWVGAGKGWVRIYPSDMSPLHENSEQLPKASIETKPFTGNKDKIQEASDLTHSPHQALHQAAVLDTLSHGGAYLIQDIPGLETIDTASLVREMAWSGQITSPTFAPVRRWIQSASDLTKTASVRTHRRSAARMRRPRLTEPRVRTTQSYERWALVPSVETNPTKRAVNWAHVLLDRYGIVSREVAAAENIPFSTIYPVFVALEESGTCRRGYFVDSLSPAQFAATTTVDTLRQKFSADPVVVALAATDPANPYGAILSWPHHPDATCRRTAGAVVVIVEGSLVFYLEYHAANLISFPPCSVTNLSRAAETLASVIRQLSGSKSYEGKSSYVVQRLNGNSVHGAHGEVSEALLAAGFLHVPKGLRLR